MSQMPSAYGLGKNTISNKVQFSSGLGISPIFFEVEIPYLVSGCILGWQSVVNHFGVTVTVTYDLLS